jgi:hypothetical protein
MAPIAGTGSAAAAYKRPLNLEEMPPTTMKKSGPKNPGHANGGVALRARWRRAHGVL